MSDNNPEDDPEFLKQVLSKAGVQIAEYIGVVIDWKLDERDLGGGGGSDGRGRGPNPAVE